MKEQHPSHLRENRCLPASEAIVYVKELDILLTMKVLDNTPAVLSLGKLCDENGYSYEWISGQKPHLIKNGIRIPCNTENFVPIVVPGLSSSSSGSSSTSKTPSRQESHSSSSSSTSSSSPTVSEIKTRERGDQTESDISPVHVSTADDERSGRPDIDQAIKILKTIEKNHRKNRETRCWGNRETRYILKSRSGCKNSGEIWWMMKFLNAETLTPVPSHEVSLEPAFKRREDLCKHSVYTHFPKDRNCEIKTKTSQETQRSLQKFLEPREETKSHLHWQFLGIRQSLWRSFLESLHVDTTPIGV